jgi:YHS domain-containing protein
VFRAIFYLLSTVVLITVLRGIIGIIARAFSSLSNPPAAPRQTPRQNQPRDTQVPLGGELKKDPACGTYIATATSLQEKVGGETFYFCSKQCRDKYVASLAR